MPSCPRFRRFASRRILALAGSLLLALAGSPVAAQLDERQAADLRLWASTLESGRPLTDQRTAAARLLESGWPEAYAVLAERLKRFDQPEPIRVISESLARMDSPPPTLFDPLLEALVTAPDPVVPSLEQALAAYPKEVIENINARLNHPNTAPESIERLLSALGRFRRVESVDVLIPWLDEEWPDEFRHAARDSLVEITGQDQLDHSMIRWQMWWSLNRSRGQEGLLNVYVRKLETRLADASRETETLRRERDDLTQELLISLERQYALTAPENRSALLERLLGPTVRAPIRSLALTLVERAIVNAEPIEPAVVDAVARLAADPDPRVRRTVSRLLSLVDGVRAARIAMEYLETESDRETRDSYLAAIAKAPTPDIPPLLIDLLDQPADRPGVVAALLASARRGLLSDEQLTVIAGRLLPGAQDPSGVASLTPNRIELLAWAAHPDAQSAVEAILSDRAAATDRRLAAARGLRDSGRNDEALVSAANDPELYAIAAQGVSRAPTVDSLERLLRIPPPSENARIAAVTRLVNGLPPAYWLEADDLLAAATIAPEARLSWWRPALDWAQNGNGADGVEVSNTRLDGLPLRRLLLRVAHLCLESGDAPLALAAVQAAPAADEEQAQFDEIRAVATLAVDGPPEPVAGSATGVEWPADYWLRAIEVALTGVDPDLDQARRLADALEIRFAESLSDDQRERLESAIASIPPAPAVIEEADAPTDGADGPAGEG
ncbi:MAG: hypothetical protein ACF8PN_12325 [Phycisphaerales bacterium]